jgi:hypothetical protein
MAELGFQLILNLNQHPCPSGLRIRRLDLTDGEDIKQYLGKKYSIRDVVINETYILDLSEAKIDGNVLIFPKGKTNFYKA